MINILPSAVPPAKGAHDANVPLLPRTVASPPLSRLRCVSARVGEVRTFLGRPTVLARIVLWPVERPRLSQSESAPIPLDRYALLALYPLLHAPHGVPRMKAQQGVED